MGMQEKEACYGKEKGSTAYAHSHCYLFFIVPER